MEFVEQLKLSVDIVDVIGQYVRLRKAGPRYTGLCPFHTEKTASFSVHSAHQFYKCFGCGAGGDVIKFVMEIEGLTFYEALKLLAERYGIPMPRRADYSDPDTKLRAALYRMHEIACEMYRAAFDGSAGAVARAYVTKRGLTTGLITEFGLGFSEASGQMLARRFEREKFTAEEMEASGLVLKRDSGGFFDRFRGRLMFPIHNESGKCIAFGGRALAADAEPKYLNSSETPIYKKSQVLYNLHRAKESIRKNDRAVLVEGYMDVIGVWSAGVHEVVASCGTALTPQQVRSVRRHANAGKVETSRRVVVNFDPDRAGIAAAEKSIQMLLDEGMHVRVLQLNGDLDPDEYVKEHGAEAYQACVEKAPGYFLWLADRARAKFDMRTAEGRMAGLQFLLPAIQRISDKLERAAIADEVSTYLGIERSLVLDAFRKAAVERREKTLAPAAKSVPPIERILLNAILTSAEVRGAILPKLLAMSALERFATSRIFKALAAMDTNGSGTPFAELEARMEQADRELLTSIVFADKDHEDYSLEQALACLEALEKSDRESSRTALKLRIKEAERAGMLEEAFRLAEELGRLDKA